MKAKKPPVRMTREMLASVTDPKESDLARKSVAESMERLFPTHTYSHEEVEIHGKLRVINYTYEYSILRDLRYRIRQWIASRKKRTTD